MFLMLKQCLSGPAFVALLSLFSLAISGSTSKHTNNAAMNTAIDFRALMEAERNKMLDESKDMLHLAQHEFIDEPSSIIFSELGQKTFELQRHAVEGTLVKGIYYIPDFLSQLEADELVQKTYDLDESLWRHLHNRRLQIHGGIPHISGMFQDRLPTFLQELCHCLRKTSVISEEANEPNHVLLNEYTRGQGIAPHKDGPLYEPMVAILSLGSPARLDFWASREEAMKPVEENTPSVSVLCEHRSLLVFCGEAYNDYWHGILPSKREEENETYRRTSYTLRRVRKVLDPEKMIFTAEHQAERERREKQFEDSVNDS